MLRISVFLVMGLVLVSIPVSSAVLVLVTVPSLAFGQPPNRGCSVPEEIPPGINVWIHAPELGGTGKLAFDMRPEPPGSGWRRATEAEIQAYRKTVAKESANFKLWIDDPAQGGTGAIRGGSQP